jgi:hypothetical protein
VIIRGEPAAEASCGARFGSSPDLASVRQRVQAAFASRGRVFVIGTRNATYQSFGADRFIGRRTAWTQLVSLAEGQRTPRNDAASLGVGRAVVFASSSSSPKRPQDLVGAGCAAPPSVDAHAPLIGDGEERLAIRAADRVGLRTP